MRPLVEGVSVADLSWEVLGTHGLRRKLLSLDSDSERATQYVNIPEGWKGGGVAHYHEGYEEVFVLHGDVSLTGRDYLGDGSYIYRPAGIVHGHDEQAKKGCHCVIRTGGKLELILVHEPEDDEEYVLFDSGDDRPFVIDLRTRIMPWEGIGAGTTRYRRKVLSESPTSRASTTLVSLPPGWQGSIPLNGADEWEWFVIDGDAHIGGAVHGSETYGSRPVGSPDAAIKVTARGATLLLWRGF